MADFVGIFRANFVRNHLILHWFHKCVQCFVNRDNYLLFQQQSAWEMSQWEGFEHHDYCPVFTIYCAKYQKLCNNNLTLIRWYSPASKIIVLPEGSSWGTLLIN